MKSKLLIVLSKVLFGYEAGPFYFAQLWITVQRQTIRSCWCLNQFRMGEKLRASLIPLRIGLVPSTKQSLSGVFQWDCWRPVEEYTILSNSTWIPKAANCARFSIVTQPLPLSWLLLRYRYSSWRWVSLPIPCLSSNWVINVPLNQFWCARHEVFISDVFGFVHPSYSFLESAVPTRICPLMISELNW